MLKLVATALRTCLSGAGFVLTIATGVLLPASDLLAAPGESPALAGVSSRKQHGAAGAFDLPLSLTPATPTTEPRFGLAPTIVFTFDKPVTAGVAVVTEGTATAGNPTFSGNEMIVPLTGTTDGQYLSVAVTRVRAADGGTGGRGAVRLGLLTGDVNQNRVVTLSDQEQVHAQIGKPADALNYLMDVDVNGTVSAGDETVVNWQLTVQLPAPPSSPANQAPQVSAGANQTITLPGNASLTGSVSDDGRPNPPGAPTVNWSKFSGPGTVTFASATSSTTTATFSEFGSYVLRFTADDGALSNCADVTVDAGGTSVTRMLLTIDGLPAPIEILAFQDGASQPSTFGGGGGAAKVRFNDATFTATETAAGPLQLAKLATGWHFNSAVLDVRSASTGQLLSKWRFEDLLISSYQVRANDLDPAPQTEFSLSYSKIHYTVYRPNGTSATMGWDIKQNKRI